VSFAEEVRTFFAKVAVSRSSTEDAIEV